MCLTGTGVIHLWKHFCVRTPNQIFTSKNYLMTTVQKITPNLWFDKNAEEAVKFYNSIFNNSKIGKVSKYGKEGYDIHGMKEGTVMTIQFWLEGQEFIALNGGPHFNFNEAVSFIVNCDTQAEIDRYWEKLSTGGDKKAQVCGWLKDQFGLSWQIVPKVLPEMLVDSDSKKSQRVMKEMLQMKKIDIETLKQAYNGAIL